MATRGYKSENATNLRGKYQEQFVVITQILDHKHGHFVEPNMVVYKYLDFKKDVNPSVHVRVFNSIVKANAKSFEEYMINVFNYTLRDTTSN